MDDNFDVLQLEHDDDDPERAGNLNPDSFEHFFLMAKVVVIMLQVEEQEENEKKLEARYQKLVAEPGPHSPGLEILVQLTASCPLQAGALELSILEASCIFSAGLGNTSEKRKSAFF